VSKRHEFKFDERSTRPLNDFEKMAAILARIDEHKKLQPIITTAPAAYDGFGTVELSPEVGTDMRGRPLRLVVIQPDHLDWQLSRYSSGLHVACSREEAKRWPDLYRMNTAEESTP